MKYSIQWYYLGEYTENIDSNDINGNLLGHCISLWKKWRPYEQCTAYVYDEAGNCMFVL